MKSVIKRKLKLYAKRDAIQDRINNLQNIECSHINVQYKFKSSTGNYDRNDNYWIEWTCPHCDKYWTTPQDNAALNKIQELDGVRVQ